MSDANNTYTGVVRDILPLSNGNSLPGYRIVCDDGSGGDSTFAVTPAAITLVDGVEYPSQLPLPVRPGCVASVVVDCDGKGVIRVEFACGA